MESLAEQVEYGHRCMHGTPLGTPGGADLMCGLCEDGLTEWVDDPQYALSFTYGERDQFIIEESARRSHIRWWASDVENDDGEDAFMRIGDMAMNLDGELAKIPHDDTKEFYRNLVWQAVKVCDGYWINPHKRS